MFRMTRTINLVGLRFGRLVVTESTKKKNRFGQLFWRTRCDCGKAKLVLGMNLRSGNSTSCGCLRLEGARARLQAVDRRGFKNGNSQRAQRREGANYIASSDPWYKLCASRFYYAKAAGIPTEFMSPHAFATYCKAIAPLRCPVFGKIMRFSDATIRGRGVNGFLPWSYSIDRRDPKCGYTRDNIQIISNRANLMKRDASPEELRQFALWVLKCAS